MLGTVIGIVSAHSYLDVDKVEGHGRSEHQGGGL